MGVWISIFLKNLKLAISISLRKFLTNRSSFTQSTYVLHSIVSSPLESSSFNQTQSSILRPGSENHNTSHVTVAHLLLWWQGNLNYGVYNYKPRGSLHDLRYCLTVSSLEKRTPPRQGRSSISIRETRWSSVLHNCKTTCHMSMSTINIPFHTFSENKTGLV